MAQDNHGLFEHGSELENNQLYVSERIRDNLSAKGVPLTKQEVLLLLSLVENNPVIFSKGTNAVSNKTKEDAWVRITHLFNASVESGPRKPEQLRLKWENLKKNARKRNNKIMRNNAIKENQTQCMLTKLKTVKPQESKKY
ncbi:unnamed protein product [Leptidea sinapis]|uniref:Regulatory protein zeste n=1 Tax=Leptidea sinapis TaxID=189913 RepID=A0A5E4R9Z2_9NEOP|nr:unnamed protein product [Leptidea sinapis]